MQDNKWAKAVLKLIKMTDGRELIWVDRPGNSEDAHRFTTYYLSTNIQLRTVKSSNNDRQWVIEFTDELENALWRWPGVYHRVEQLAYAVMAETVDPPDFAGQFLSEILFPK